MKTVKTQIKELINNISASVPEEYEWFEGINSIEIINDIEKLYPLIDKISQLENPIQIAYVKYTSLRLINKATQILKNKFNTLKFFASYHSKGNIGRVNEAGIYSLSMVLIKLCMLIKEFYLIEVIGSLQTKELGVFEDTIRKLRNSYQTVQPQVDEIIKWYETVQPQASEFIEFYNAIQPQAKEIKEWHESIAQSNDNITNYAKTAEDNLVKITEVTTIADKGKPKIEQHYKDVEEMCKAFQKQKEDIQEIIEDANRASMAGSFKKQQDDINKKMIWADTFLIASLIITAAISLWGFKSSLITQEISGSKIQTQFDWIQFLAKSAISLPFLIVAWIKSKERAYLFRLREDYAYKYSSAMAFEGYRKQVQEQSPELNKRLLEIAVNNLGYNPTKVFDKDLKSTPLESIIDGIGKHIEKAFDGGIKKQVKNIPQKTKELINKEE